MARARRKRRLLRPFTLHAKLVELQIALMTFRVNCWARIGCANRRAHALRKLHEALAYREHLVELGHYG